MAINELVGKEMNQEISHIEHSLTQDSARDLNNLISISNSEQQQVSFSVPVVRRTKYDRATKAGQIIRNQSLNK